MNPISVSAFFPCYNDAGSIATMIDGVDAVLRSHPLVDRYDIIVVNDGSRDDSGAVLEQVSQRCAALRVITHESNRGYGGALITGFGAAQYDWIFYTDGDAQYDPGELQDLLVALTPELDVVQGWKRVRGDSWYRKVIGRVYHHVVKLAFGLTVRDTDCDFRLFRRALIADRPLTSTSGVICVEMMYGFQHQGARFVEVPVSHFFRPSGKSQFFRVPAIARSARQLAELWWRLRVRHQ